MIRPWSDRWGRADLGAAALVAAAVAALYGPGLLPGTGQNSDTAKYHYIGAVLGISHPPGSPLYILLNWAVAQIPAGELAWRLNLFSAVMAGVAAVCLYGLARELARSRVAAFVSALALVVSSMSWEQGVVAEVYTLHGALLVGSAWLLTRWHRSRSAQDLGLAALTYGLSFGVHLMSWYLLPGWIAIVLFARPAVARREAIVVVLGAVAGASTYLYYAIRPAMHPIYAEVDIDSIATFVDYVTGSYFRRHMFAYDWSTMLTERRVWIGSLAAANVGLPLGAAAIVGGLALWKRDVRLAVFVTSPIVCGGLYAMGYAVTDARVFALPALYFTLVAAAVGLSAIAAASARLARQTLVPTAVLITLTAVVAADRVPVAERNRLLLDRSTETDLHDVTKRALGLVPNRSTIMTGSDLAFHAFGYHLWGARMSGRAGVRLMPHSPSRCQEVREHAAEYLQAGPVFATTELAGCFPAEAYSREVHDLSRTLTDYLASVRPGRLILVAIHDEGTAAIPDAMWARLEELGVLRGMRGRHQWSYAAALVRTASGFEGVADSSATPAAVTMSRGDSIGPGRVPVDIAVKSGGQLSGTGASIIASGVEYARPLRGVHVVEFHLRTGLQLGREVFDTHATVAQSNFHFFRVAAR